MNAKCVATLFLTTCLAGVSDVRSAALPGLLTDRSMADFTAYPVVTSSALPPIVMLNLTKDHQLFFKAYNDFSDLDNDGAIETTYKHEIDYYGYFDSFKCYTHNGSEFQPTSVTTTKYCNGEWSGNFLNWVTTARIDAVRKLLYGGKRAVDTNSKTVLERAYLPTDSHSWAKYYDGADANLLTPYAPATSRTVITTFTTAQAVQEYERFPETASPNAADNDPSQFFELPFTNDLQVGDQVEMTPLGNPNSKLIGTVFFSRNGNWYVEVDEQSGVIGPTATTFSAWRIEVLNSTGISFCNTTPRGGNQYSEDNSEAPQLRVALGNYELWGANEVWQCQWTDERRNTQGGFAGGMRSNGNRASLSGLNASAENPPPSDEYKVFVEVCKASLVGTETCQEYPNGNLKPVGLLQRFGEDGQLRFGMMTGSYENNVSGGVLRKNVGSIDTEVDTGTGLLTGADGIISNLDAMRIFHYNYDSGNNYGNDGCTYQRTGIYPRSGSPANSTEVREGNCSSWGNPMSEIYLESLRYLAGESPTTEFTYGSGSSDGTLGLTVESWQDPLDNDTYCASLNVLNFNASISSYDFDQFASAADLGVDAAAFTDQIGAGEGISGTSQFIGSSGGVSDDLCTAKTVGGLSQVSGLCPEAPSQDGSFLMSGLSYWAHTNRIRNDLTEVPSTDETSLKVETYGIALATNVPRIVVPVPGSDAVVRILPAYRLDRSSNGGGPFGSGTLVDFRVVEQNIANGTGRFYVNWEDSEQGGDFDQDMWGIISYKVANGRIEVTTDAVSASTANGQGFGYIISGTNNDGPHFHSGIYNFDYTDSTNITVTDELGSTLNGVDPDGTGPLDAFINASGGCRNCEISDPPTKVVYEITGVAANSLEDPMWYAAKWGGFDDQDGDDTPNLQEEWDQLTQAGLAGQDGIPDNFFYVTDPRALEESLTRVFSAILQRVSSGTAAAVVANSVQGIGAVYQALYEPERADLNDNIVNWIGTMHALWIDDVGLIREDNNGNAVLDDYTTDLVSTIFFDETDQRPKIRRCTSSDPDEYIESSCSVLELEELATLWNGREQLSDLSSVDQRSYTANATAGRYIFTWVDENLDGRVNAGEQRSFEFGSGAIDTSVTSFLNVLDLNGSGSADDEADLLINYVRGNQVPGLRNRQIDYDLDGGLDIQRLGDVVHSTPSAVGTPAEAFDLLYGDESYAQFRLNYRNRRQVVYVGANDGMLHAFNAGFYRPGLKAFETSPAGGGVTAHPLGAELWAYIPGNLLPHLRWTADPDYSHVFYVDGKPRVFDVKVLGGGSDWGTILAVPFRLGGGEMNLDTGRDGLSTPLDGNDITVRSGIAVLDITDPESPPEILAELPLEGYSTSVPAVIAIRDSSSNTNKWFMVVGTGPDTLSTATSSKPATISVFDLNNVVLGNITPAQVFTLPDDYSFVGDFVAADWDLDFEGDAFYFGSVTEDPIATAKAGSMWKLDTNGSTSPTSWSLNRVYNPSRPSTVRPALGIDNQGTPYVFGGTGKLLAQDDKKTTNQELIFGFKDETEGANGTGGTLTVGSLVDVTSASVNLQGDVSGVTGATDFDELLDVLDSADGWFIGLTTPAPDPAERVVSDPSLLGGVLLQPTYTPNETLCEAEGSSSLYGVYFKTGTAAPSLPIFSSGNVLPTTPLETSIDIGVGQSASPSLHVSPLLGSTRSCQQTSTGAITCTDVGTLTPVVSGEVSWRELRGN